MKNREQHLSEQLSEEQADTVTPSRKFTKLFFDGADFLGSLSKWSILISAGFWVYDSLKNKPEREERTRINESWASIYTAWGKAGDGGRISALTYLAAQGERLTSLNLEKAALTEINLAGANVQKANMHYAWVDGAILEGANLYKSDLTHANLKDTSLKFTDIRKVDFSEADLKRTDFRGATFCNLTKFHAADMIKAKFLPTAILTELSAQQRQVIQLQDISGKLFDITLTHDINGLPKGNTSAIEKAIQDHHKACDNETAKDLELEHAKNRNWQPVPTQYVGAEMNNNSTSGE